MNNFLLKIKLSEDWLKHEVISAERLHELEVEYNLDPHPHNLEHYPLFVFDEFIKKAIKLNNSSIDIIVGLIFSDLDEGDIGKALILLLSSDAITYEQFLHIASLERVVALPFLVKAIKRIGMLRRLDDNEISFSLSEECLESKDSGVQRKLVEHPSLDVDSLVILSQEGVNKKIRNIATQEVRKRGKINKKQ